MSGAPRLAPPLVGVLGGTFDPIHHGHLRPALDLLESLALQEIRFIPLAQAVHRPQPRASAALRLDMLAAAIRDQPGFRLDPREIDRQGPSYSLDTLTALATAQPGVHWCLILGSDAYRDFLTWRQPLAILELAHLLVMERPGGAQIQDPDLIALTEARRAESPQDLRAAPAGRILFQPVTPLAISSTQIRALLAAGRNPRYLLPDPVLEIIRRAGLYLAE